MKDSSGNQAAAGLDAYYAYLDGGQLVLEPFCACGEILDDSYHCPHCDRHAHPTEIVCADMATLQVVEKYIRTSPKFRNFTALVGARPTRRQQ